MYRCLIVDDDTAICQGLPLLIDWEACGFCIVETATNGKKALEWLRRNPCDLLLTDIRMPLMDGLELVRLVKEEGIPVQSVILSGYQDFTYAQRAISYGVRQYILKPIQERKLIEMLNDLREEIRARNQLQEDVLQSRNALLELGWNLLLHKKTEETELVKAARQIGIPIGDVSYHIWLCVAPDDASPIQDKGMSSQTFLDLLQKETGMFQKNGITVQSTRLDRSHSVSVLCLPNGREELLRQVCRELAQQLQQKTGGRFRFCVGGSTHTLSGIRQSFDEAVQLSELDAGGIDEIVSFHDDLHTGRIIASMLNTIQERCHEKLSLRNLSAERYMNSAYLGRLFRQQTGLSFQQYLVKCRMNKAKQYLTDHSLLIGDISERVGYEDVNHFCHVFKEYVGSTPSDYRASLARQVKKA